MTNTPAPVPAPLSEGMEIDPNVLAQIQSNTISQNASRMVQMEAAIQQLLGENHQLKAEVAQLTEKIAVDADPEAKQEG